MVIWNTELAGRQHHNGYCFELETVNSPPCITASSVQTQENSSILEHKYNISVYNSPGCLSLFLPGDVAAVFW